MALLHSFRNRFLAVAVLLALVLLVIAIYTSKMVSDESRDSQQLIAEYNLAGVTLRQLNDHYLSLKSSLYQYTLLLTPELKKATQETVKELDGLSRNFQQGTFVDLSANIKNYTIEHNSVLLKLQDDVKKILAMQDDAEKRYPAVAIMLNELQPLNRLFRQQLEFAIEEAADLKGDHSSKTIGLLEKIRYAWARHVSEVRLFVGNRSGTFGEPETVLPDNIRSVNLYAEHIASLLHELREIPRPSPRTAMLARTVNEMILTSAKFTSVFKRTVDAFMDEGWRADVYFLEYTIDPLLKKNINILQAIENELSSQLGQRVQSALDTSSRVSDYIWWFVVIVYVMLLLAYFAFEKTIRQPLFEVARALEAQGNDDKYEIPSHQYFSSESELLINAFNDMKEQVDSRQLRLQSILQNTIEGIVISDTHGVIETFNPAAEKLFSLKASEVIGHSVACLLKNPNDMHERDWVSLWANRTFNVPESSEVRLFNNNQEQFISIKTSTMMHLGQTYYISVVSDVTEHKAFTDRLQNLADMDSLTNLHNRRYFTEELDRLVDRSNRRKVYDSALIFIDLDNFKIVNDTYGHHAGDRVLVEVSALLQLKVRSGDLLARLGGDEFAVILYDIDSAQAQEVAQKYQKAVTDFTFYEQGKVLDVGCTIGVSMLDSDIKDKDEFLNRADFACQMAKQMGRNRVYAYSEEDNYSKEQLRGQMGLAQTIKEAIRCDGFKLVLQPIKAVLDESIHCYEVLIRMLGENNKVIMPFGFLPSAERFDLMKDIDAWVIRHSLSLLAQYQQQGKTINFSINLSAQSIGDFDIIRKIEDAIAENNVSPENLIFEITESNAISNMSNATQFLQHLRDLGCRTALDDFGAGYSSYAYLKDLPADFVKIDGAFVKDMNENDFNFAMVKSMNEIAHVMGKQTIAEFVENEAVMRLLKDIGVDYAQGYFLGKPAEFPAETDHDAALSAH